MWEVKTEAEVYEALEVMTRAVAVFQETDSPFAADVASAMAAQAVLEWILGVPSRLGFESLLASVRPIIEREQARQSAARRN